MTFSLLPSSPLIDAGDPAGGRRTTDLVGGGRVEDGNDDGTAIRDMGAYELQDTTPPNTSIAAGPSGPTTDSTPTFSFGASPAAGNSFRCAVDEAAFGACSGPGKTHTTAPLADGVHTFRVRATDAAGNPDPTPAARSFTVDTKAPDTKITSGPSGPTNDPAPKFAFTSTETGSTFKCRIDGGSFGPCAGPPGTGTVAKLADGPHKFAVEAIDAAGNVDPSPASRSFTVDTKAPAAHITKHPKGKIRKGKAVVAFVSNEPGASFQCSLDKAAFRACSSPVKLEGLKPGRHKFSVRAIDKAGNRQAQPATIKFKRKAPRKH